MPCDENNLSSSLTALSLNTHVCASVSSRNNLWDQWDNSQQLAGSYNDTPRSFLSNPEIEQKLRAFSREQSADRMDGIGYMNNDDGEDDSEDADDDDDGVLGDQMFSFDDFGSENLTPSTKAKYARNREKATAAKVPVLSFTAALGLSEGMSGTYGTR